MTKISRNRLQSDALPWPTNTLITACERNWNARLLFSRRKRKFEIVNATCHIARCPAGSTRVSMPSEYSVYYYIYTCASRFLSQTSRFESKNDKHIRDTDNVYRYVVYNSRFKHDAFSIDSHYFRVDLSSVHSRCRPGANFKTDARSRFYRNNRRPFYHWYEARRK